MKQNLKEIEEVYKILKEYKGTNQYIIGLKKWSICL